jgi:hypothetical protein
MPALFLYASEILEQPDIFLMILIVKKLIDLLGNILETEKLEMSVLRLIP